MRVLSLVLILVCAASAQDLPRIANVEHQPLAAQVLRLLEALDVAGEPLPPRETAELRRLAGAASGLPAAVAAMQ
ncbi:MAG: hypothetical protein ABIZ80_08660, partial [Bryobacteraceae bacterium]